MADQAQTADKAQGDVWARPDAVLARVRLYIEAFNARDVEAACALVSEDVQFRGPNGSALRGYAAVEEVIQAASHVDLVVVRTAREELDEDDGTVRVTVPIREIIRKSDLFRTAVIEVRDGAIVSYATLTND
jgi:ketosteroid isomerase-like protein